MTWLAVVKARLLVYWGAAAAVLVGLVSLWLWGRWSGTEAQANKDKAATLDDALRAAGVARGTQQAASDAVQTVRDEAAKQTAPDVVKRDDLDSKF